MYFHTRCVLLLALVPASLSAQQVDSSANTRLRALYTAEWAWRQREFAQGERGAASDRFARVDAASQQSRLTYWTRVLASLDSIPLEKLSTEERINAQVLRTSLRALVNDIRFKTYEAPFNSDSFFWTEFTPRAGFGSSEAYRNYGARMRDIPRYFGEQITNMRAGLARRFTVARAAP